MQGVTPKFSQWGTLQIQGLVLVQGAGQLGLAAGHQHHVLGFLLQAKGDGVVGGGVAGVQRGDHVDLLGQLGAMRRFGHAQIEELHALKAQPLGQNLGRRHQLAAGFDAIDRALAQGFKKQVINDEAQIRLARTMIGQRGTGVAGGQLFEQLFDELEQVVDLLELAARVLVELAVAGQDVQLFQQIHRLAGAHFGWQFGDGGRFGRSLSHGLGPTSSFFQPSAPSLSRVSILVS